MTRWQGTASAIGLAAEAPATARTAFGSDRICELAIRPRGSDRIRAQRLPNAALKRRPAQVKQQAKPFGWLVLEASDLSQVV